MGVPKSGSRARTEEAKDARRQVLLDAALDEFFDRGFAAARMSDIAKRAELSKGTLYLYFDSKEALFRALIETVAVPRVMGIEAALARLDSIDEALRLMSKLAPELLQSPVPKVIKVLISDAGNFPQLVMFYREQVVERVLRAVSSVLARAGVDDPTHAAPLVVAPFLFSAIWQLVLAPSGSARLDLQRLFARHRQVLIGGLATQVGSR